MIPSRPLTAALLILTLAHLALAGIYSGGTGQLTDPYLLATPEDWLELTHTSTDWNAHFILTADLDLAEIPALEPVGPANLVLDGQGYTIRNATLDQPAREYVALFSQLGPDARISNLIVHNITVSGSSFVGALAGASHGWFLRCHASGSVTGEAFAGGLVGHNMPNGGIRACSASIDLAGTIMTGGLVGFNEGFILACSACGNVDGVFEVGALVGFNNARIAYSTASGPAKGSRNVGGLVGNNLDGLILACCATGAVQNLGINTGGLVGTNSADIFSSYATGNVSGNDAVGGLLGENRDGGCIAITYAVGSVSGQSAVGGLVGLKTYNAANYKSYWNTETSGQATSQGGRPANTDEMKNLAIYSNLDWDFVSTWTIDQGKSYPRFLYQRFPADVANPFGLDLDDLALFSNAWLASPGEHQWNPACDLNHDTFVNLVDLAHLCDNWLQDIASPMIHPDLLTPFSGGAGTQADPFLIATPADWFLLTVSPNYWSRHFRLTADIDLALVPILQPIAPDAYIYSRGGFFGDTFKGIFDGAGHVLYNATVADTGEYVALFGCVDQGAQILNLSLEGVANTGSEYVAGLAAANAGLISNCHATGSISANTRAGGLVAYNYGGTIDNCHANTYMPHAHYGEAFGQKAGALCGVNTGHITNSYATGFLAGTSYIGGLVGLNSGFIDSCHAYVVLDGSEGIGGLVGQNDAGEQSQSNILNSWSNAWVAGEQAIGGLVGRNHGPIESCSSTGTVLGDARVGGLVGDNSGTIADSQSASSVTGVDSDTGGLLGYSSGDVTDSYATGSVTGSARVGGLAGDNLGYLTRCYASGSVQAASQVGGLVGQNSNHGILWCFATGNAAGAWQVGGLVGLNLAAVTQSYATGNVAAHQMAGGLVGMNGGSVNKCYAAGLVSGDSLVGGLIGLNDRHYQNVISFWDTQTSNCPDPEAGQPDTDNIIGKTTPEMMTRTTFTDADWNFDTTWTLTEGQTYPLLQWQLPTSE